MTAPKVSVIVVSYNMSRELPRTVASLLPPYQRDIASADVEIIVVDNGSSEPVRRESFPEAADIKIVRVDDGGVSPCIAINRGVRLSHAECIAVVIDGARMASPGLLATALSASVVHAKSFVATLGFHLGPKVQQVSVSEGYTRQVEDELLAEIGWPDDGYRLFEMCARGGSYLYGLLSPPSETCFCVMRKSHFYQIGGYDERFVELGGGLANIDFFLRAVESAGDGFVMLIGEGTFHQLHYGSTTRAGGVARKYDGHLSLWDVYQREYEQLVGRPLKVTTRAPLLFGRITHPEVRELFFGQPDAGGG